MFPRATSPCEPSGMAQKKSRGGNEILLKRSLFLILFSALTLVALAEEKVLMDQEVMVLRGDFKELHFLVPEAGESEFRGEFKSTGGINDDITFRAMNQAN